MLQLSPPGRPQTKECPLLGAFLYTVSPQFMPLPLAEAKIGVEPKGDGSYSLSGTVAPQKSLWVQTQGLWLSGIAPVWDRGTSKKLWIQTPRLMAQWHIGPCLEPWDLKKGYRFKSKGDGSVV
jgi:hypothetical protein